MKSPPSELIVLRGDFASFGSCYARGDQIMWVGSRIETMLWDFTEYHYDDGTPNYYYELYNPYSQKYIAPQFSNGQILSDAPIGVNLPGRREGEYYSDIIAWDDPYYSYASLTNDIANGAVASGYKCNAGRYQYIRGRCCVRRGRGADAAGAVDHAEHAGIRCRAVRAAQAQGGYSELTVSPIAGKVRLPRKKKSRRNRRQINEAVKKDPEKKDDCELTFTWECSLFCDISTRGRFGTALN